MIGKVIAYDPKKRYGYIMGDDGVKCFFHESEINIPSKTISPGYMVQFSVSNGFPHPRALSIRLL